MKNVFLILAVLVLAAVCGPAQACGFGGSGFLAKLRLRSAGGCSTSAASTSTTTVRTTTTTTAASSVKVRGLSSPQPVLVPAPTKVINVNVR